MHHLINSKPCRKEFKAGKEWRICTFHLTVVRICCSLIEFSSGCFFIYANMLNTVCKSTNNCSNTLQKIQRCGALSCSCKCMESPGQPIFHCLEVIASELWRYFHHQCCVVFESQIVLWCHFFLEFAQTMLFKLCPDSLKVGLQP